VWAVRCGVVPIAQVRWSWQTSSLHSNQVHFVSAARDGRSVFRWSALSSMQQGHDLQLAARRVTFEVAEVSF